MAKREAPRRKFWLSHLAKWRTQGGTMKAYAQAHDLPVGTFYAAKSAYARVPSKKKSLRSAPTPRPQFLPVQLAPPQSCEPTRINFPNGIRIEMPGRLEPQQWRTLLEVLGGGA
jgi:hypothetical protein